MSNIDPSKPTYGNATTQSVRDNFTIAKSEIEALQAALSSGGGGGGTSAADIEAYFASRPTSDAGLSPGDMFWNGGFLNRVAGGVGGTSISNADIEAYFASLPTSDAGLATNKMFWNGGFLCKKV